MLTVSCLAYTTESMTLNDTLETFTLRGTDYIHIVSVIEQFYSDCIT